MHVIALHMLFTVMVNPVVACQPANVAEYNQCFIQQFEQPAIVAEYKFND